MSYDEHLITQAGGDGEPRHAPDPSHSTDPAIGYWCTCGLRFNEPHLLADHIKIAISSEYGKPVHATFCSGNHTMGESPCTWPEGDEKHRAAAYEEAHTAPAMDRDSLNEWRRTAPYPIEESTGDFTLTELFGWYDGNKAIGNLLVCSECGSAVPRTHLDAHRLWHNKLLP